MNRNLQLILFFILIVGSILAFVYYKKNYAPKYDWTQNFKKSSDQPYGLKLFYTAVKKQSPKFTVVRGEFYQMYDTSETNSSFVSIGSEFFADSTQALDILKYVERGNHVFLAVNYSPLEILRNFVPIGDSINPFTDQRDSVISLRFINNGAPSHNSIKFHYQQFKDTAAYYWGVYRYSYFNGALMNYGFKPLFSINDSNIIAFYREYGKGRVIVHANPILFTNYYMVTENGFNHANHMLTQLRNGHTYWDEGGALGNNNDFDSEGSNPLKFLFSHPYLKMAWYLLVATIVLYVMFRSKREQRIIPILPLNTNASIEYTKAIGTLYFQNKGQTHIAAEMYTIFLSDVRARYNINTDVPDTELVEQLSQRSGIDKRILYNLFKQFKYVKTDSEATKDNLIQLYNSIENYHKKRK